MADMQYIGVVIGEETWHGAFSWKDTPSNGNDLAAMCQNNTIEMLLGGMKRRTNILNYLFRTGALKRGQQNA